MTGQPRVVGTDVADATDPDPDNFVTKLESFIKGRIAAGKVEAPRADNQSFYGVIVPQGVSSHEHPNAAGAHSTFTHGGFTAAKAWIMDNGTLDTNGSAVHIFSHEFAEASASGANISCKTADGAGHEIADICHGGDDLSNGYSLHSYFSKKANACVLPLTRPVSVSPGPVAVVSRGGDSLDLATVGHDPQLTPDVHGMMFSAAWDQTKRDGRWRGWWAINSGVSAPGGAISMVSRAPALLDVFATGTDGKVATAAWDQGLDVFDGGWRGWWPVGDLAIAPGAPVGACAQGPDQLDIFVAGTSGHVRQASWAQSVANGAWQGWTQVKDLVTASGGHVTAISRKPGRIDLFAVAADGSINTTFHGQAWHDWAPIGAKKAPAGAAVVAVSRGPDILDVFVVTNDGLVHVATSDQAVNGGAWSAWTAIGSRTFDAGGVLGVAARGGAHLHVFAIGPQGDVWTADRDAAAGGAWSNWSRVANGTAAKGSFPSAVSRDPNKVDVFMVGTDNGVWTAAMDVNAAGGAWQGWQPVPN